MLSPQSLETSHQNENNELINTAKSLCNPEVHSGQRLRRSTSMGQTDSPEPKRPALAEPPALTFVHLLFKNFHAKPLELGNLFQDVPLSGREEDDGESRGILERVEEGSGRGLVRDEVFLNTLPET